MARARKTTSGSKGNTFSGVFIGLILGLAAALLVALFVTKAPLPFVDRFSREPEKVTLPPAQQAPDPNQSLYSQTPPAIVPGTTLPSVTPPTITTPVAPPPSGAPSKADTDELNKLIANLPPPMASPAPPKPAPAAKAPTLTYYLQAGAFSKTQDADAMAARLLMLGLNAHIQKGELNGASIHRVRLGPFQGLDEMNRVRSKLSDEKIDTSVVRSQ
ncbi:SPOR domain-containing protein [Alcaligenes endophyticus]|uniref:SPOR domain-containing protein n=1 Tax=Alcaligenes endophyticus TaxID=1929088 RepID=A0ABT8EFE8_9BURK|nr:SPOR domain-containing protein [Alcaligenes endophyticus]MCX5590436.1 SPOR domain-containing protein [Alcaligenes endophyticus]MDN4119900.1 SPOR domain-containing protein [Alcaligenes endophyticus]